MRILFIILIIGAVLALILVVGGRVYFNNSPRPSNVGTGNIAPCPTSPNCVSSQGTEDIHQIDPFEIGSGGGPVTLQQLEQIMAQMDNSTIITKTDDYLYAEFRSPFWRFIDDVEFFVSADQIDVRSAARLGYSDLDANRKRVELIRKKLTAG